MRSDIVHGVAPLSKKKRVLPRKRKSTACDPTLPLAPGQAQLSSIRYTDNMNDFVMSISFTEAVKGTYNVMKGSFVTKEFEELSDAMSRQFPIFDWNSENIKSKYDSEKKRFRAWISWRDGYFGASFDKEGRARLAPKSSEGTIGAAVAAGVTEAAGAAWAAEAIVSSAATVASWTCRPGEGVGVRTSARRAFPG